MYFGFYVVGDQLIAPTTGMVQTNRFREIDPVLVAPVHDRAQAVDAIAQTLARGNPPVQPVQQGAIPPAVVLRFTKFKRWGEFEKKANRWVVDREAGSWRLCPYKRAPGGRGLEIDDDAIIELGAGGDPVDLATRVWELISDR